MHPKERRSLAATRREFLARTGGAAFALSGAGGLLAACSNSTTTGGQHRQLPPARRSAPAACRWPAPTGASRCRCGSSRSRPGMKPETGGEFTIFNYPEYIYGALLKEFGKKYDVTVKVTPFDDINTGVAKLASGAVQPDVTEMTPDNLDRVVAGKLIKPINLDYIPNLKKNVWPSLVDPFYDVGSRYGVPYTAYATGIAWRTDQVKEDIPSMSNPWDIFWQAQAYKGKTALLSEVRETIAMALLRKGELDINTEDPAKINQAVADLQELYNICNIKVGDLQYSTIPEDKAWLNQAWSGDMMSGLLLLPAEQGDRPAAALLEPGEGQGADPERHVVGLHDHQEAGAGAPVPQLHAGQRQRLLQLRQLQRLPAAAERDRSRTDLVKKKRHPRDARQLRADRERPRARLAAGDDAHDQGPVALAERLLDVPVGRLE